MPKIALSAGHHSLTGGNKTEIELVGPITKALAKHCREQGFDVRVITPDEGLGMFRGGLRQVAQTVVDWFHDGWTADVFLEVHAEDNGRGDAGRGCFTIFPDVGSDSDGVVRDTLGPQIARAISDATDIPVRGTGVLSERKTHVFQDLHARLGIFEVTSKLRVHCRRMIVEVGAYSSPKDLKIMRQESFADKTAGAIAGVLAEFFAKPEPQLKWYRVLVEIARTREGPGTQFRDALQGEARLRRDDVFAGDEVVQGEKIGGTSSWVHRADQIGFVSMALLEEDS
ncbi:MAG TPA: N-acetylmuramoyl-L-alanine amidase [Herpetosiphonaceae bacterium]